MENNSKNEEALNELIKPIREWLAGNEHRNALVILSEPKAEMHLVLVTNTTSDEMFADMGMIVGMEPQLSDTFLLVHEEAMGVKPITPHEANWVDTIDYMATCGEVETER